MVKGKRFRLAVIIHFLSFIVIFNLLVILTVEQWLAILHYVMIVSELTLLATVSWFVWSVDRLLGIF